jgi:hypothetical protein
MVACSSDLPEVAGCLIDRGARLDLCSDFSLSALGFALNINSAECIRLLIQAGYRPSREEQTAVDRDATPMRLVCRWGSARRAHLLAALCE